MKSVKIFGLLSQIAEVIEPVGRVRLVASIVGPKSEIVSLGVASKKTHPLQARFQRNEHSIYLHAEVDALRRAIQKGVDLSQCSLYICRIKYWDLKKKRILGYGLAKPCEGCQRAIETYKIKKVFHTLDSTYLKWCEFSIKSV